MSCDIHIHTEIKVNGEWHHYSHPDIDRNYSLFGKMAGVRNNDIEPITEPKGIPENVSFTTKFDYEKWRCDAHSASYLNLDEIEELITWIEKQDEYEKWDFIHEECGFLFGNGWNSEEKEDWPEGLEDARWVFWFDN